jgi:NAD(P) transhydrogenase subunit alpha
MVESLIVPMLKVLIPLEEKGETRVAASPDTVKSLCNRQLQCFVEKGAGTASGFSDENYLAAGAELVSPRDNSAWAQANLLLTVGSLTKDHPKLGQGTLVVGQLAPHGNANLFELLQTHSLSAISLELLPRISRAQSMDVLSSQANIAGYKAVLLAAAALDRYVPMLMTAAGTVQPAKVLVIGAGVAGLQAVATARRLGAVVKVSDVRPAAREQVESLGARFIEPPFQGAPGEQGGYAKEATAAFLEAQRQGLAEQLTDIDMVICTAQVPGKPAPLLLTKEITEILRPGAVVVDLAVAQGGNCELSEVGRTINHKGVVVVGADRLPATVPHHASSLYARNVASLLAVLISKTGELKLDPEDPLLDPCLVALGGQLRRTDLVPNWNLNEGVKS